MAESLSRQICITVWAWKKDIAQAAMSLGREVEPDFKHTRFSYVYAIVLVSGGHGQEAQQVATSTSGLVAGSFAEFTEYSFYYRGKMMKTSPFISKLSSQNQAQANPWSIICLFLIAVSMLTGCQSTGGTIAHSSTSAAQIDREVDAALAKLYETTPSSRSIAANAKGILVFPHVVKAGFIGGAEYGKGAMRKRGRTTGYYNIVAGSYGLQAGVQSFGYAMFFMNDAAMASLDSSRGLEVGVGPNIVVMDEGMAKKATTTTLRDDVYAFVFGQRGLMAGLGLQGSKITRINP